MKLLVSLSFSLMDQKCPHCGVVAITAINDIVSQVDDRGLFTYFEQFS